MESFGYGYAQLKINDSTYEITSYEIDINMMLGWMEEHQQTNEADNAAATVHSSSPKHP